MFLYSWKVKIKKNYQTELKKIILADDGIIKITVLIRCLESIV